MIYLRPILIGLSAGTIVAFTRWTWIHTSELRSSAWMVIVGVVLVTALCSWHMIKGRYFGLTSLFLQVHAPTHQKSKEFWLIRLVFSYCFIILGAPIGIAAVAIEMGNFVASQSRAISSKWFETQRRTDTAMTLASGLTATFTAPLTGILFSLETRTGGNALSVFASAISAFISVSALDYALGLNATGFAAEFTQIKWESLLTSRILITAIVGGVVGSLTAVAITQFLLWGRKAIENMSQGVEAVIPAIGGGLLILSITSAIQLPETSQGFLTSVLLSEKVTSTLSLSWISYFLGFTALFIGFGTIGIFYPLLAMGVFVGAVAHSIHPELSKIVLFCSGAALWTAMFRTPFSATVLVYEFTGNPILMIPCFVSSGIGMLISKKLNSEPIIDAELSLLGFDIKRGRITYVLDSIQVDSVMETDYDSAFEKDSLYDLDNKLSATKYPFLIVKNERAEYVGLLSAELIESSFRKQSARSGRADSKPLTQLIEARDLLYRNPSKLKTVTTETSLSKTLDMFDDSPVIPVINKERKVQGLLFAHNVRIAYDREVARRSLIKEIVKPIPENTEDEEES